MRKAEKRRLGEERAKAYLAEERERGLAAQRIDKQIRAEKAARKAEDAKRKSSRLKSMKKVADAVRDESSIEMECM